MPRRRTKSGADGSRRDFLKASGAGAIALSLAGCPSNETDRKNPTSSSASGTKTTERQPSNNALSPDDIEPGGTLKYGMDGAPDSSNIILAGDKYSSVVLDPIYDYGTARDPVTFEVKPSIFTDWTLKNAKKDKPDAYFNYRRGGIKWNNGEIFGKEDILYSYQFMLDNKPDGWSVWNYFERIEEAKNNWDFHIKMSEQLGSWDADILGSVPIIPKHKWEGVDYKNYNPIKENEEGPVGTGPGQLIKWDPETSMQVKFRRDYIEDTYALNKLDWKKEHDLLIHGGPFLDGVNFKIYDSGSAMTHAFLKGEIDTHYGTIESSKSQTINDQDGLSLIHGYDSGFSYCGFNCRRSPLDDVAFRQAMAFMFDDVYWKNLHDNFVIKGDYAQSPGYKGVRPESVFGGDLLTDERTNAFDFRAEYDDKPDVKAVRKFLTNGQVIDGSSGTYAGKKVPGSFSGIKASQSNAKYNYSFGPVKSVNLKDADVDVDKEIRINGKTVPRMMDGEAITLFTTPPSETPKIAKAHEQWTRNLQQLGIPAQVELISFSTLKGKVFKIEDFDVYPIRWENIRPNGASLYRFFYSENAGENTMEFAYNSTGYGNAGGSADKLLENAHTEMDSEKRSEKYATAMEKIYYDMPYMVTSYDKYRWPVNSQKFGGFVGHIIDPANVNWNAEYSSIYLKENLTN